MYVITSIFYSISKILWKLAVVDRQKQSLIIMHIIKKSNACPLKIFGSSTEIHFSKRFTDIVIDSKRKEGT